MASVLSEAFRFSRPHAVGCSAPLNSGAVTPKKKRVNGVPHPSLSNVRSPIANCQAVYRYIPSSCLEHVYQFGWATGLGVCIACCLALGLCESRDGRPGLPVPNNPYGL